MDNEISANIIPNEGSVTISITEYHKLLNAANNKKEAISLMENNFNNRLEEKDKEFKDKLEEKDKEIVGEQKDNAELQRKVKKALKIISDNISKMNIHGEKDTIRAGAMQEAMLDGVDALIQEFENLSDDGLMEKSLKI